MVFLIACISRRWIHCYNILYVIALLWQQTPLQMRQEQMHKAPNENPNMLWKKPENCSYTLGCSKKNQKGIFVLASCSQQISQAVFLVWCPKTVGWSVRNFEWLGLIWEKQCPSWLHKDSKTSDSFGQSGLKNWERACCVGSGLM